MNVLQTCKKLTLSETAMKFTAINFQTFKDSLDEEFLKLVKQLPEADYDKFIESAYHDHWARTRQEDFAKLSNNELNIALKAIDVMLAIGPKVRLLSLGIQGALSLNIVSRVKSKKYQLLCTAINAYGLHQVEVFVLDLLAGDTAKQLKNIIMYEVASRARTAFHIHMDDGDQDPALTICDEMKIQTDTDNLYLGTETQIIQ